MGFNSAWGYWSAGWMGNVSCLVLLFKTLNDLLGEHAISPLAAFLTGSALLWLFFAILMSGIREGAILNFIVTTAKLIPILLIIFLGVSLVRGDLLLVPDWQQRLASNGEETAPLLQLKGAMAIILWCFVGVEAASVLSGRAKSQQTVRLATILSLLVVLTVYMLITVITMASIPAGELADSQTPLALVLSRTLIGTAGGLTVKLGIMVSVLGASLSWILLGGNTLCCSQGWSVATHLQEGQPERHPGQCTPLTQCCTQLFCFHPVAQTQRNLSGSYHHRLQPVLIPYLPLIALW